MNLNVISLAAQAGGPFSTLTMLLVPVLMLGLVYFMTIRPQKKQEKKLAEERSKMQVGDTVISIGGIMGKVVNIQEHEVTIASSVAGTMLTFRKEAINQILKPEAAKAEENK